MKHFFNMTALSAALAFALPALAQPVSLEPSPATAPLPATTPLKTTLESAAPENKESRDTKALEQLIKTETLPIAKPSLNPQPDLWVRLRQGFGMPNLDTALAQNRTQWYAAQPDYLARMMGRAKNYLFFVVGEVEKRGMPTEIALLPFIESAFNPQATSHAAAAGMWQFIPSTGKAYQLTQNAWTDERRNVIESTRAALDYLQKLHGMFGDWHLALAAYNWGEGAVQRAINKNKARGKATDYTALQMPKETQYYVPKFQAIKNIIASPAQYGIALPEVANEQYFTTLTKDRDIDIVLAARFAGLSLDEFKALNPGFKRPVILGATKPEIVLPLQSVAPFKAALENHQGNLSSWSAIVLNQTEKPANVAAKYGMSEAQLREANGIPAKMLIKPGSTLIVPRLEDAPPRNIAESLAQGGQMNLEAEARKQFITVRRGDSLDSLAKRYGVTGAELKSWNDSLVNPYAGQKLVVYVKTAARAAVKKPVIKTARKK